MKKAYGYCRASTGKQDLTFEVQRASIQRHYEGVLLAQGFEWGGFYEDKATSGGTPFAEREKGRELWVVAQPGDAIIWHKMDRAFRSVRDGANTLHLLGQKKIAVHSLDIGLDTSTALGDFVSKLLMLLGELERSWVSNRTKEAIAAKRARGMPINNSVPAGYRAYGKKKGRFLVPDKGERELLDTVYQQFMGRVSIEKISNGLYLSGVKRFNGPQYHVNFLIYALHARALGYPERYDRAQHNRTMQALDDAGKFKRGRTGVIERMRQMEARVKAARQAGPSADLGAPSASSSQSSAHTQPCAQTP
jgi:DNA invertase Pin-like site-specific DNA recombinase